MGDSDELFDVRNTFLLSAFQQCIAEAAKVKVSIPVLCFEDVDLRLLAQASSDANKVLKDSYVYRSYLAQVARCVWRYLLTSLG